MVAKISNHEKNPNGKKEFEKFNLLSLIRIAVYFFV
jgi:hypothetical protein